MAHISPVGRRSWRVRAGLAALYVVLIAGAITTVYPFLLMVSTATKSQVDYNEYTPSAVIPHYWHSETDLYRKYVEDRYANNLDDIAAAYHQDVTRLDLLPAPFVTSQTSALVDNWNRFAAALPPTASKAGFGEHDSAPSQLIFRYQAHCRDLFHNNIDALNRAWIEENISFDGVTPPFERTALRTWMPDLTSPKLRDWYAFKPTLPQEYRVVELGDPLFRTYVRQDVYQEDLKKLNAAWGTSYSDWNAITLPPTAPVGPAAARTDWETFVRTKLPLRMLRLVPGGSSLVAGPMTMPTDKKDVAAFDGFVRTVPVEGLQAETPENLWRASLVQEFQTVDAANAAFGTQWKSWADAQPPEPEADLLFVRAHAGSLRREFATRNFRAVADYILLHGNAVGNTVIFCVLSILAAVIVNPLCAYALSRYPLPYAYKVLLFLLSTMAFPAEVAMIPNFLLLRDMHLLNTFGALVLPGLASGFSIFLLKGFFDSLPRELYEAGIIDGATEVMMFRTITVPLSLPIFAVIALDAFTGAYGAFLFAMVTCQDPKMWTLMVWLYNLQDTAPTYEIMAALTLAAIPTLLVFVAAQKVIMRGIILPSFK